MLPNVGLPSIPQEGDFLSFFWKCEGGKVLQSQTGIARRALGLVHQLAQGKTSLEPDSLGSNLSFATYSLVTLGEALTSLCLSFLISKMACCEDQMQSTRSELDK